MAQATNNSSKRSKGGWLSAGRLLALALCAPAFAETVSYTYDGLNRLTEVNYNSGQQIITYSYDAAGNMLSQTVGEGQGPLLTVTAPVDSTYINTPTVFMLGTATDAGVGDNGIASVTINGMLATGGTTTGAEIANWSISLALSSGENTFTVIATDASAYANQAIENVTLTYIPFVIDTDGDGLDDSFELAIGTDPALADTDGDGINDGQELGFDGDGSFFNILTDTAPLNHDTDGDGVNDGAEVAASTDPLDNTSYPLIADGDVNGDGQVDLADLLLAMRILNGQYTPTPEEQARWDVAPLVSGVPQPDGQNTLGDYVVLQRKVLGIISF